jgi:hypothetical protein
MSCYGFSGVEGKLWGEFLQMHQSFNNFFHFFGEEDNNSFLLLQEPSVHRL